MANNHQVLALVEKGLNNQEIAKKLKCSTAYVRATKRRATPEGQEEARAFSRKHGARWRDDNRELHRERNRNYQRKLRQREAATAP